MNAFIDRTLCGGCGVLIEAALDQPHRQPCPACGSLSRAVEASVDDQAVARDGYEVKVKRPGKKKPRIEDRSMPSFSVARQKVVHHERVIDRENDRYSERVTDYETGEIIHKDEGPLSGHRDHGSAKKTAPSRGENSGEG